MTRDSSISWPLRHFPRITNAGVFPLPLTSCHFPYSSPTIALHLHDYEGLVTINGKQFQLQPGDLTFSPARRVSVYDLPRAGQHLCIHFHPAPRQKQNLTFPLHFRLGPRTASARERIWRVIDHYRRAGEKFASPSAVAAGAALLELLIWLHVQQDARPVRARGRLAENSLGQVVQAIEASLHRPVTVAELAAQGGWSADYISRLFRRHYALTLPRFVLLRRMELARQLLLSSNLPIQEIGNQVGIADPQYFNKQFRKIAGLSPSAYRLTQRKQNVNKSRRTSERKSRV
jgi:AraC-like DNA-binding protein